MQRIKILTNKNELEFLLIRLVYYNNKLIKIEEKKTNLK